MQGEKVREKSEFLENKKSQGKVRKFCYVKFIFSQSEHPNFENFLGSLEKSGKSQGIYTFGDWTS